MAILLGWFYDNSLSARPLNLQHLPVFQAIAFGAIASLPPASAFRRTNLAAGYNIPYFQ
jgi:hypothetical protein